MESEFEPTPSRQGPLVIIGLMGIAGGALLGYGFHNAISEPEVVVQGNDPGAGFGSSVAMDHRRFWVGAPHGDLGRVFRV
ncbi:MAG: hypothetical protein QGG40_09145, partial [Myxococcota bacterium]|nr:hypothetical protein [Myxococcota bacterium]